MRGGVDELGGRCQGWGGEFDKNEFRPHLTTRSHVYPDNIQEHIRERR